MAFVAPGPVADTPARPFLDHSNTAPGDNTGNEARRMIQINAYRGCGCDGRVA